jgi:hypothetical protein
MSEMVIAYEIRGVPWLAVRVGRALERWGARSARPLGVDEFESRLARRRAASAAVEARRSALVDMHRFLR